MQSLQGRRRFLAAFGSHSLAVDIVSYGIRKGKDGD